MKRVKRIIAIYLAAVMLLLSGCDEKQNDASLKSSVSFFAMDTYITVTAYGENAERAANASKERIETLEKLWSVTDSESEIYHANSTGQAELSSETAELVRYALERCRETKGALDITLYPVVSAWGFTKEEHRVPSDAELTALLENQFREDQERRAPVRHTYGQYRNVYLSDEEMDTLQAEFPNDWQQRIEAVSEYVANQSNGLKKPNHTAKM